MEENRVPTPHIGAQAGEIAETILLPGDPLRAKYIADNFLTDVKQFNGVRNMFGYTGYYKGKRVSVMGTGMGCPSIGIYSYELIHFYGCKNLIRVGTAGALQENVKIRELPPVGLGWDKMGVLAVEMEAAALYSNAAAAGVNALCILTISDSAVTGEATTAEERQTTFTNMMEVALELA